MAEYLITPPPELVQQWASEFYGNTIAPGEASIAIANQAARWGADTELEACCEHLERIWSPSDTIDSLRAARRPKPPSLKERALEGLTRLVATGEFFSDQMKDLDTIRRALEALPDD
jgi:hypothetical protein